MTNDPNTITPAIFEAFARWINQRPGLDYANYGNRTAYNSESRSIQADGTRARRALALAKAYTFNAQAMADALRGSFSGRLSWDADHFDYTTGQYWPTEYRKAAAAVLESYCDAVRPTQTPAPGTRFTKVSDLAAANEAAGGHWFSRGNMKFARSRVSPGLYHGKHLIWFVSTEKSGFDDSSPRRATVRVFDPSDASVDSASEYGAFYDVADARKVARELVKRDLAGEHRKVEQSTRCEFCGHYGTWCSGTVTV